jgi:hypothetical protein
MQKLEYFPRTSGYGRFIGNNNLNGGGGGVAKVIPKSNCLKLDCIGGLL